MIVVYKESILLFLVRIRNAPHTNPNRVNSSITMQIIIQHLAAYADYTKQLGKQWLKSNDRL